MYIEPGQMHKQKTHYKNKYAATGPESSIKQGWDLLKLGLAICIYIKD